MITGPELLLNCVIWAEVNVLLPVFSRVLWSGFDMDTAINLSYLRARYVGQSYDFLSVFIFFSLQCSVACAPMTVQRMLRWVLIFFSSLSCKTLNSSGSGMCLVSPGPHAICSYRFQKRSSKFNHNKIHITCLLHVFCLLNKFSLFVFVKFELKMLSPTYNCNALVD